MNIYARYGEKVRFCSLDAGYEFQQEAMVKHLKLGEVYTVHHTIVHDSSTEVFLKEAPGISFNSVFFEDMDAGSRFVNFWYRHGAWATETFGAQRDHVGPMKHLAKEAVEAQVVPANPIEFADCLMLVLSGVRNSGMSLDDLLDACEKKLEIVKTRHYPAGENGEPIEHDRSKDIVPTIYETLSTPSNGIEHDPVIGMLHPCQNCNDPVSAGRTTCDECITNAVSLVASRRTQKALSDIGSLTEEAAKLLDEGGAIRKIDGVFHYVVNPDCCPICKGSGYIDAGVNFNPCLKCKGEGTVAVEQGE